MIRYIIITVGLAFLLLLIVCIMYGASEAHDRCSNCKNCLMFDRKGRVYCSCIDGYGMEPPSECKMFLNRDTDEEVLK